MLHSLIHINIYYTMAAACPRSEPRCCISASPRPYQSSPSAETPLAPKRLAMRGTSTAGLVFEVEDTRSLGAGGPMYMAVQTVHPRAKVAECVRTEARRSGCWAQATRRRVDATEAMAMAAWETRARTRWLNQEMASSRDRTCREMGMAKEKATSHPRDTPRGRHRSLMRLSDSRRRESQMGTLPCSSSCPSLLACWEGRGRLDCEELQTSCPSRRPTRRL